MPVLTESRADPAQRLLQRVQVAYVGSEIGDCQKAWFNIRVWKGLFGIDNLFRSRRSEGRSSLHVGTRPAAVPPTREGGVTTHMHINLASQRGSLGTLIHRRRGSRPPVCDPLRSPSPPSRCRFGRRCGRSETRKRACNRSATRPGGPVHEGGGCARASRRWLPRTRRRRSWRRSWRAAASASAPSTRAASTTWRKWCLPGAHSPWIVRAEIGVVLAARGSGRWFFPFPEFWAVDSPDRNTAGARSSNKSHREAR